MDAIKAIDGTLVTEEMIEGWCDALDNDEWPSGWVNVGDIVSGQPPVAATCSEPITTKVTKAMKNALVLEAEKEGISTSEAMREALTEWLLRKSA